MMLQLGASVLSVEPQPDLARALRESIELNCWSDRGKVVNALACAPPCPTKRLDFVNCENHGWRFGNMFGPSQLQRRHAHSGDCAVAQGLPTSVGGVALSTTLLSHARSPDLPTKDSPAEIEFIKMDADGPEGVWLSELDTLITAGKLRVGGLVVEGSNLDPVVMQRFQMVHGYVFFRLDVNDGRRVVTPEGWDARSQSGTLERLDRLSVSTAIEKYSVNKALRYKASTNGASLKPAGDGVSRLKLEDEMWAIRNMRHVFRIRANLSLQAWVTHLALLSRPPLCALGRA